MPGHRLRGLRRDDPASIGGDSSNGEVNVEITEIVLSWEGRTEPTREMVAQHAFLMTLVFILVVGFSEMPAYLVLVGLFNRLFPGLRQQ